MNLHNKVIAVTGAARGIGLELAQALLAKGAKVALLDLNEDGLNEALNILGNKVEQVQAYVCDVSEELQVVNSFARIVKDFGVLHGLVNNAGILRDAQLIKVKDGKIVSKMSATDYDLVVNVHMKGAFLCAREAATQMIECNVAEGCIVNMSSIAYEGNFGQTNYSAAKAGIIAQSRVWAKELGRYGIRSMVVAPGTIETELLRSMPADKLAALASQVPLQRIGCVDNVAQTVVHIFENDYLTGRIINVDGGISV